MIEQITQEEFDLLRRYIKEQCGIALGDDKKYLVQTRLARLVGSSGCSGFSDFYRKVSSNRDASLRDKIVDAMTTNETLWFRDTSPWVAFRDVILAQLTELGRKSASRRLRIWSTACSTGQEPYTVAMLIDDVARTRGGLDPHRFEILATDISPSALMIAKGGRYDRISMRRGFTADWASFKDRYFTKAGTASAIRKDLKERVTFRRFNLQDSFVSMGKFDVVLMRNVAIYFSDDFKREVFRKVLGVLNPGGFFMLGSAESLKGYSEDFVDEKHGRALLYRPRGGASSARRSSGSRPSASKGSWSEKISSRLRKDIKPINMSGNSAKSWPRGGSK